jgi:uncharacterized surface protein with fasciclin (FAS1) repeats
MLLNKRLFAEALTRKERVLQMKLKDWTGKKFFAGAFLFAILAVVANPGSARAEVNDPLKPADIVETAVGAGQFKTLAAALEAAGLIDALKGAGPFTVFAPTDEAFAKLPAGTVETLLKPENKEKLKSILLYHVVSGNVPASEVLKLNGRSVETLQGSSIKVQTKQGVRVDDAKVIKTDVTASNGVIHVIDTVLMPKM